MQDGQTSESLGVAPVRQVAQTGIVVAAFPVRHETLGMASRPLKKFTHVSDVKVSVARGVLSALQCQGVLCGWFSVTNMTITANRVVSEILFQLLPPNTLAPLRR